MNRASLPVLLLCQSILIAQQQPGTPLPSGTPAALGRPQQSTIIHSVEDNAVLPTTARTDVTGESSLFNFAATYRKPNAPPLNVGSADRARSLVRDGKLYLSLYDALSLAIENNLDVEVERYNLSIAGTERLRASGGGDLRGIDYSIAESPTGVGGPGSPLLNSAAASVTPTTPTVNDLTSLNILTETPTDLSVQGPAGFAAGPTVPAFQPTLVGQNTYFQRSNTTALSTSTLGSTGLVTQGGSGAARYITANYALVQGFSPGTQVEVDLNNATQALYGNTNQYDPFSSPNTSVTVTQPLLRGFGKAINLRYIRIASINQRISRLLFYQQLISTVYGVARLYYDLVSLNENVEVQRETLAAAQKLFDDDRSQVEQGTLAPLELTRAQSLVTSSELGVIQAEGLVRQQEVILKTQLARKGTADPVLGKLRIVPTDRIVVPSSDEMPSVDALVAEAEDTRPDLAQASLQVQSGEVALKASQNAARPEVDVIGNFQTRGSTEVPFSIIGTPGTGAITAPTDLGVAGLRTSRIYQAGVQFNLPLKNHVAEADAARDLLQLRQSEARTQILANQVREDVENSVIALQTARTALDAAIQSRKYQEQLVDAERDKLSVGASTNFLVIQQQGYLAQARSTEVAARSVWIKARVALDRSVGNLLQKNGITFSDSVLGQLPVSKPVQP
jgi:outer membrane protein